MAGCKVGWLEFSVPFQHKYYIRDDGGYKTRGFTRLQMVTHPSTNQTRHRVTSLIETNALPLSQAATGTPLFMKMNSVVDSLHVFYGQVDKSRYQPPRTHVLHLGRTATSVGSMRLKFGTHTIYLPELD